MRKSEFTVGTKFTSNTIDSSTIYTVGGAYNDEQKPSYIKSEIVYPEYSIQSNQYGIVKITDKYLHLNGFVINQEIKLKIALEDIKLVK